MQYDKEEKFIIDAHEKGTMKLSKPSKKEKEGIKATAKKSWSKTGASPYAFRITTIKVFKRRQLIDATYILTLFSLRESRFSFISA
jgi:hypothetical protein